jgi:hypothetical protein
MNYPDILPSPTREGYSINPENNIFRSKMLSGRARQRILYTSIPAYAELTWVLNASQASYYEWWTGQVGAAWFAIKIKAPTGYIEQDCRFIETPQGPLLTGVNYWTYRARVEIRDRILIDDEYASIVPTFVAFSDIFDLTMNKQWPQ